MPAKNSQFLSINFLVGARNKHYWLPKMAEINQYDIASPPSKADLAIMVHTAMHDNQNLEDTPHVKATCERLLKFPPDSKWLVSLLYTMNPKHPIFAKDYVRPNKRAKQAEEEQYVTNEDGFYDSLPISKHATRKRGIKLNAAPILSRKEKFDRKMSELKSRMDTNTNRIQMQMTRLKAAHEEEEQYDVML
jgi:hypothetical protein